MRMLLGFAEAITFWNSRPLIVLRSLLMAPLCHFNGGANDFFSCSLGNGFHALLSLSREKKEIVENRNEITHVARGFPFRFDFIRLGTEPILQVARTVVGYAMDCCNY